MSRRTLKPWSTSTGCSCVYHHHPFSGSPPPFQISVPTARPLTWKQTKLILKCSELHDHGVLNRVPFRQPHGYLQDLAEPPTTPRSIHRVDLVAFPKCFVIQVTPSLRLLHPLRCGSASSRMGVSVCNHDGVRTDPVHPDDSGLVRFRTEVQGR